MKKESITDIKSKLFSNDTPSKEWLAMIREDERLGVQKLVARFDRLIQQQLLEKEGHLNRLIFENSLREKGYHYIAGVDEVGRGPLAGPVVTAAVILPENCDKLIGVNDSKQLTEKKRHHFVKLIKEVAIDYAICELDATIIDRYNILEATRLGMKEAVKKLKLQPDYLLIDAMTIESSLPQEAIIKGDSRSLSIAAASILAKDYRDRKMIEYATTYPEFGFEKHMGYPTAQHIAALTKYGITPIHRKTFAPVKEISKIYSSN